MCSREVRSDINDERIYNGELGTPECDVAAGTIKRRGPIASKDEELIKEMRGINRASQDRVIAIDSLKILFPCKPSCS